VPPYAVRCVALLVLLQWVNMTQMTAVVKVLNAHMTSLQYLESSSAQLETRLKYAAQLLAARTSKTGL
jgi:hypothetical protein